ncbi:MULTISPECIES: cytochrome c biogenesis protein CcsA [Selenomonas]|jgi:heme exporter protein C|uniref:Heme exporter protein C n=1 Tax=Selenomonas flueggei ATCC 43531 TaxID=638302 RepID=C4V0J1_9FIRM|nr:MULTISPECIES: cytochrome c biogenesis protein CcsA [Selenomonas]EEQ49663.1 cytochrome c assembly protein [Selenomonas flueggei ATCC 43531]MBF1683450.1 cytochrome c biogenesis protein CcsA [Selenomonas sp.]MBF1685937.1 cytochrome c biogenesis protein CcsA [Selenomonas sp.]MBF1687571.1 cytochrome c biogenesis protein CcsA [Selenomonas sp.]MBF1694589.1 cytochrome c biogenesis protein CcsA [Selenomonas sp.]
MLVGVIAVLTLASLGAVFFIVPPAEGLGNYVRIAFFHIPTAWVAVVAFFGAAYWGARYLKTRELRYDAKSARSAILGLIFTLMATVSGAVFSKLTWGAYWNWDPRQTTIFVLLLIYAAYVTLRMTMRDERARASSSAVYALFSFIAVPFLVFILPRMFFSLHPSPVLNETGRIDMDAVMLGTLVLSLIDMTLIYIWLMKRGEPNA